MEWDIDYKNIVDMTLIEDMSTALGESILLIRDSFLHQSKSGVMKSLSSTEEKKAYSKAYKNIDNFIKCWLHWRDREYETPIHQVKHIKDNWDYLMDKYILEGLDIELCGNYIEYRLRTYLDNVFRDCKDIFVRLANSHKFDPEILAEHFDATGRA